MHVTIAAILTLSAGIAAASGRAPTGVEDRATVTRGAVVSTLDSGQTSVLANDLDPEGDFLTAVLSRKPKRGELVFNKDGTFSYRHNGSSNNTDEFQYRAFDGRRFSRRTKVKIQVVDAEPIPPEIVGQAPISTSEDVSVRIRLEDLLVVDPDNDFPQDFSLEVGDGENYTRIATTITPVADFNGELAVPVRVSDGTDISNVFDLRVEVIPQNDAPFVVAPIPDQEAVEGVELELTVAANFDDIDAGDRLLFTAAGLPSSGSILLNAETGLLRGTPIRADARDEPYLVVITATDSNGSSVDLTFALTVQAIDRADLAIFSSVAANPTPIGEPISWSIEIENRGPGQLEAGELVGSWATSGPFLSLSVPDGCAIDGNDSSAPTLRCTLPQIESGTSLSYFVDGVQNGDGENTLIALAIADDPVTDNNTATVSAQVAIAFSEDPTQALDAASSSLAVADFNSDGLLDLVTSGTATSIYLNTGNRSLQATGTTIGGGGAYLALLDWNGDGMIDVAEAGPSATRVGIYLGSGSGLSAEPIQLSTGVQGETSALGAADLDGDGDSEFILAGSFGTLIARSVVTNQALIDVLPGGAVLDLAVADLNQDGFPDIAAVTAADRSVSLLRNLGDGRFVAQDSIRQGSVARVVAADLDGDEDMDLLLALDNDDLTPPHIQLMHRQSDWNFVLANTLGASTASDLLTGDVNGDGRLDIVAVNEAGVHQVYIGEPDAQFSLDAEQIVSPGMQRGKIADFNADESLDLILVGAEAPVVEIYANNGIGRLGQGDRVAPELVLNGQAQINLASGATFEDPGASAVDDIDGDLTDSIVVSGTVNTTVVGTYQISYTVSDRASNTSQVSRTVTIGVNQGTGGGGGGAISLLILFLLATIASIFRSRRIN